MVTIPSIENEETEYFTKYDKAYLTQYDELFMLMYVYLNRHRSIEGYVNLTVKDFLLYYNFVPDRNKGRINEKIYDTLQLMIDDGFILYIGCYSNGGLASVKDVNCNMMFTVQTVNFKEKWNPECNFVKILYSEIDNLRKHNVKKIEKVLAVYVNIKKHISADEESLTANLVAFPSEKTLSRECDCSISSIKKYTDVLCEIKMLYVRNYGSYLRKYKGKEITENSNNVYALKENYLNDDAKEALRNYLKSNYGYIDGFFPFCNNLPNSKSNVITENSNDEMIWGEPDPMDSPMHDYSIEEILEMPTMKDVEDKITGNIVKTENIPDEEVNSVNNVKIVTVKPRSKADKTIVPHDIEIQNYAEKLYKHYVDSGDFDLFKIDLTERFPDVENCEKYWNISQKYAALNI